MKKAIFFLFSTALLLACTPSQKSVSNTTTSSSNLVINGKLFAVAYMQRSAEYHALCLQAYNIATLRLNEALQNASSKPRAVITDIDETLLDNSADEVHHDLQGKGFDPKEWTKWTGMAAADTIPGALTFFKYAASKNVEVFYITNRDEKDKEGTLKNLKKFDFPYADEAHLVLKQGVSSKEARRQKVMEKYDVVLLLGDNLSDFSSLWDSKTVGQRLENVQHQSSEFGSRFIILPNPVYGDWENALYQYKRLTPPQQDSAIKSWLKNY
ncbi:MAG: 5'-nucleotidase, lipoprotein e(P4) family [Bacteroidetes bacterium]|nr:5'-nucleotidase, lipoprotein e(P4) family [Bacteroidota bacterium]MBS1931349.1 5'-nucleotidase, lipoprotein e(P4) family [Bacteroidota bacterium]